MTIILLVVCVLLVLWVVKLSANVDELRKINQYNFEVYKNKFEEIDDAFKSEREDREHLLERIHDIERKTNKL